MNDLTAFIDGAAAFAEQNARVTANDFTMNGLLYCGMCKTAKQHRVNLFGIEKTVFCLCKCAAAAVEERERLEAEKQEQFRISRLRAEGIQDRAIARWTFVNDDCRNAAMSDKAMRYYSKWRQMYEQNIGILLWGNVGTGKTFFAACIANALIENGIPVLMSNFAKIINALGDFGNRDKNEYIESLNRYKLLIIDDLGAERQSDYAQEIVYSVIDARYKNEQPLIVTTNMTLDEIKHPKNITYSRIYDRILEMCVPVEFKGENRRRSGYEGKRARAKALFES